MDHMQVSDNGSHITDQTSGSKNLATVSAGIATLSSKAQIIRGLSENIPTNDFGLPPFIYRADLVPANLDDADVYSGQERSEFLDAATLELDYSQGFPTLPDGEPFWSRLPFEPDLAHRAFLAYLDLPRQKSTDDSGGMGLAMPVRQIHLLRMQVGQSTSDLFSHYHAYFWAARVKAYDMFILASHNKQKEYRLMECEDNHYRIASKYVMQCEAQMDAIFADPDKYELSAKETLDILMKMIQVQRISLGAPAMGANGAAARGDGQPMAASLEVILRQIAKSSGATNTENKSTDLTKQLFSDPEALAQAQELIIRLNTVNNPRSSHNQMQGGGFMVEDESDS